LDEGTYSMLRVLTFASGSHTIAVQAANLGGTGDCQAFSNVLTATKLGSATLQLPKLSAKASSAVGAAH
jgi:hypothetical protein